MSILLVTNRRDLTTDYLVNELNKRDVTFCRLNTDIVTEARIVIDPVSNNIEFEHPSCHIRTENVFAAYFRRPTPPQPHRTSPAHRQYVVEEWRAFLKALYISIGDRWFSHPNSVFLAEDKPRQLALARAIGFNVPETIVTNDLDAVARLGARFRLVAKPLKQNLLGVQGGSEEVLYTTSIEPLRDADRASLSVCPVIFQHHIPKAVDIRVTVVGQHVFPVAIHSQKMEETRVDWRRGSNASLEHEVIGLPKEARERCIQIVRSQNLRFGAIDLIRDPDGTLWFLECNPNGQWAWIESRTGLPIAAAIADELLNMAVS